MAWWLTWSLAVYPAGFSATAWHWDRVSLRLPGLCYPEISWGQFSELRESPCDTAWSHPAYTPQMGNAFRGVVSFFSMHSKGGDGFAAGLLPAGTRWCCQGPHGPWITLSGAAGGWCHHSAALPSAVLAPDLSLVCFGPSCAAISPCSRWPRWLWKLSRHCQGDSLAIKPSPPPHCIRGSVGPWASLLHWRVRRVFAGRFNQHLVSLLGSKAPFRLWKKIRIN